MRSLANAYQEGNGVVLDSIEAVKWAILASALDGQYKNELNVFSKQCPNVFEKAVSRAREWAALHEEVYISK
jgi:TPR repeat protein